MQVSFQVRLVHFLLRSGFERVRFLFIPRVALGDPPSSRGASRGWLRSDAPAHSGRARSGDAAGAAPRGLGGAAGQRQLRKTRQRTRRNPPGAQQHPNTPRFAGSDSRQRRKNPPWTPERSGAQLGSCSASWSFKNPKSLLKGRAAGEQPRRSKLCPCSSPRRTDGQPCPPQCSVPRPAIGSNTG